jgi:phosphatidylglycerophosphate synthase
MVSSVSVGPGNLFLRIVVLIALLVGGVVAMAETHAWWTLVLALAGLVIAAGAVAVSVQAMLRRDVDTEPSAPSSTRVTALTALAAVALILAVALPDGQSAADSTTSPTAAAASRTVRDFLASAVLEDNAYAACQYLTVTAQEQVARMAGNHQTCRDALSATQPSFAAIHSEGALRALDVRAMVVGHSTADVTVHRPGHPRWPLAVRRQFC